MLLLLKMSALTDSHGLPGISCELLCPWVVWPGNQDMCDSFWLILPWQHSCWSIILTFMLGFLFFLCPYDCYVFDLLPYLFVMQVWLFFFHWWKTCLWLLSYSWMTNMVAVFFCTSVFIDGQPWSMSSAKALSCSSSRVISLISFALMKSVMSVHDSIV